MHSRDIVTVIGLAARLCQADSPHPRGVGPEFAKYYADKQSFKCISAPAISLSPSQVNDDYCDCPDGSDEPGTAACSYLSPLSPPTHPHPNASAPVPGDVVATQALPGFYCQNKGHNPAYIRFTLVNDGICDYSECCDGSDEWGHVGGVSCPDRCKELGKEWRKVNEGKQKSYESALKKREELVRAAAARRKEIEKQIADLVTEISTAEVEVSKLQREKEETERREANRVVTGSAGKGGKASILAGLAKSRIQEMRAAMTRLKNQRDAYVSRTEELEELLTAFKEEYNPNFNDEGVKRAVRAWEEYAATDKDITFEAGVPEERDLTAMVAGPESDEIDWDEFESAGDEETADDVAALYDLSAYLPPAIRTWLTTQLSTLRDTLISNGILAARSASSTTSASESKAVRQANEKLTTAQNNLSNAQRRKTDHENDLSGSFGAQDVFRTLKDACVSLDSGEYTYELCWLDKVQQKSKKGGATQNMGKFESFSTEIVDEDVPADGRGLGSGERVVMKYMGGSHCWNGPSRSTSVVLGCAEHEEIWRVAEEEKCVYRMEVGTPAVCGEGVVGSVSEETGGSAGHVKDEL